ncbi:MAG TPA: hypothetical protein VFD71_10175 [Planctomycetota bacterium]|jgi:hypothetical protein|nr:hypothetical protein [Planctomycetota bacterium]
MATVRYDCDCDTVIAMEELDVGVEEILQYTRAVLPREDLRSLLRGIEEILAASEPGETGV